MSVYEGPRYTVADLIREAMEEPGSAASLNVTDPLRWTAVTGADACRELLSEGRPLTECWRFGILQTVDAYNRAITRGGTTLASQVFQSPPPRTGNRNVDAAFAALAEHLAERDGWAPPAWIHEPHRTDANWYVAEAPSLEQWIRDQTPVHFARRGIAISRDALNRASAWIN